MTKSFLLLFACAAAAWPQHSSVKLSNPFQTPQDRLEGAETFRTQCASCHGADAKGGHGGTDLTRGQFKYAVSEDAMFRIIGTGIPGTAMPGFAFSGAKQWQVIAYIDSLGPGHASGTGDAKRGATLVESNKCMGCHAANAPNLADAAARRTRSELRQSILEPAADVAPEYWRWRGTLRDAKVVEGRRLNEDTYSVQVIDRSGKLLTIDKRQLASSTIEPHSSMPSFAAKLKGKDLEDVLAYLESLRGGNQ
ncbi:MAG: c-type cytochrome [Acidobacteriota bacterium]